MELLYEADTEAWNKARNPASLIDVLPPSFGKIAAQFPGVDRTTLWHCLTQGQDSKHTSASKHALLTPTECNELVNFVKEMGDQGFPLTYKKKKIAEYGLSIAHTHDPSISHAPSGFHTGEHPQII